MSRFVDTLTALMTVEKITQATLAERSGIVQSTISRLLKNEREPSAEQVGQLCAGISSDRQRRIELLLAWVRDQVAIAGPTAGIDERHVILAPASEEAAGPGAGSLAAELVLIGEEAAQHDDMRDIIVDLAAMIRRHRAETIDAASTYPCAQDAGLKVAETSFSTPHVAKDLATAEDESDRKRVRRR